MLDFWLFEHRAAPKNSRGFYILIDRVDRIKHRREAVQVTLLNGAVLNIPQEDLFKLKEVNNSDMEDRTVEVRGWGNWYRGSVSPAYQTRAELPGNRLMDNIYLIDSSIYIFRAWQTLPDTIRSKDGYAANAVFGFTEFLLQILDTESPSHIACAFDGHRDACVRKALFADYKANRPPAPEELKNQFRWCAEFTEAIGIPAFTSRKYEADDIIGTLAHTARRHRTRCTIISADKDLTQFIGPEDVFWDFSNKRRLDYRAICKRFQLTPAQIPDMLALAGDRADNIPGVPGVGTTSAARLLIKWGNLQNLFNNLEQASNMKFRGAKRICQLVEEHRETVFLSRKLTGLFPVEDLPDHPRQLTRTEPDMEKLQTLFNQFDFSRTRRDRWLTSLAANRYLKKINSTFDHERKNG